MKALRILLVAMSCLFMTGNLAQAAVDWPTRPVTVIVGYTPGGMSDLTTRVVADKLQAILGQPVVIQNKGGAGGMIGMGTAAQAKPDGYTAYGGSVTQPLAMQYFSESVNLELDQFEVVGGFLPHERALFVQADAPYSTWEEFVAHVKANPDTVSVGFGGGLWAMEVMKFIGAKEGLKWKLIAYKSGSEASADFFGGHIDVAETGVGTAVYQGALAGKAKVLIDVSNDKVPGFESVPRLVDKGYPYPVLSEYAFLFPKGTPKEIVDKATDALEKAMHDSDVLDKLRKMGVRPRFQPPDDFRKTADAALKSLPGLLKANKSFEKK